MRKDQTQSLLHDKISTMGNWEMFNHHEQENEGKVCILGKSLQPHGVCLGRGMQGVGRDRRLEEHLEVIASL